MNKDFICIGSMAKYYDKMVQFHNNAAMYSPEYKILIPSPIGRDITEIERYNMTTNWLKMGEGYSSVLVFNERHSPITPQGLGMHTFCELLIMLGQGKTAYFIDKIEAPYTTVEIPTEITGSGILYKLKWNIRDLGGK